MSKMTDVIYAADELEGGGIYSTSDMERYGDWHKYYSAAKVDELLKQIETLIDSEAYLIGAVDGYDYDSGVEYGLRKAAIIVKNARIDNEQDAPEIFPGTKDELDSLSIRKESDK